MLTSEYKNEELKRLREAKNLSQKGLAERLGVTRMMIYYAENERISWKLLSRYAVVFKCSVQSLLRPVSIPELSEKKFASECEKDLTRV